MKNIEVIPLTLYKYNNKNKFNTMYCSKINLN